MTCHHGPTSQPTKKPQLKIVPPIDRWMGVCLTCQKDRHVSETELVVDADEIPHIVCSECGGELTYIPF